MQKQQHLHIVFNITLLIILSLTISNCTHNQGEIELTEKIQIPIQNKTRKILPVYFNNNDCLCIEEASQDSVNINIYNLENGKKLLTIKHPNPFNWLLRSSLKDNLLFSKKDGTYILYNLKTNAITDFNASDFGILNREFFDIQSFSPEGTHLVAKFKETDENHKLTMENTISGYKLFCKESLLVELMLENGALKYYDTISYGFREKYFFGENGFGLSYSYIDKLNKDAYLLTSPYNDEIFILNQDTKESIKVKSKLKDISVDVEPYSTYTIAPWKFNQNISDKYSSQAHISSLNYDNETQLIHTRIWNGQENEINILTMNLQGETLAETTISTADYSNYFYFKGKQYFVRNHNHEKDSLIHIDVYQYISK